MRTKSIALSVAAIAFAGMGLAMSAQQKPAVKAGASTVVVYKSPT